MYESTVTVFNYHESPEGAIWHPHVLSGTHLETDRGHIIKKYGPECKDNAILHISYVVRDGLKIIRDSAKRELFWLPPKAWKKQDSDRLSKTITFSTDMDFFMLGAWEGDPVIKDDDYAGRRYEGLYAYLNAEKDYIFKITAVGGPYNLIPHFELLGK